VLRPNHGGASADEGASPSNLTPKQKEVQMNQEWGEDNLLTPTAADLESAYGSRFVSASDVGGKKIRAKIAKVWMEELPQMNGQQARKKCVVGFLNLPKPIALNATNKDTLVKDISKNPADWIGAEIGIYTEPTKNPQGQSVMGLRLRVLSRAGVAAPQTTPPPAATPDRDAPDLDPPPDGFASEVGDSIPF
jgi:hypothetical protein